MRCVSVSHELIVSQWPDGKTLYHYKPRSADNLPINTVSWGKSGAWVLLCQSFGFPEIVSLGDEAKHLNSIQNIKNATCAAFQHTTNRRVTIGTSSGQLVNYDLKTKSIKQQFPIQQTQYFRVQHTAKDSHVIGACKDGKVYVYRANSGNQIAALSVPKSNTVTNFCCHPMKANIIGLCSETGVVAVWDFNVDKPTACYSAHKSVVSDLLLHNGTVVSIGADRRLSIFDYRQKQINLEKTFGNSPTAFDLHVDGTSLAVGFTDGQVLGFDLRTMKQQTDVLAKHTSRINQISFDTFSGKSSTSIVAEEMTDSAANKSEPSESFTAVYCDDPIVNADSINGNPLTPRGNTGVANQSDSFLAALSLNNSKCEDSLSRTGGDRARRLLTSLADAKGSLLASCVAEEVEEEVCANVKIEEPAASHHDLLRTVKRRSTELLKASTPVSCSAQNIPSPILPVNGAHGERGGAMQQVDKAEIKMMMREVVREELAELRREIKDEMKEEMKNQMFEVSMNMMRLKQHIFSLHWLMNKMAVDFEDFRRDVFQVEESL